MKRLSRDEFAAAALTGLFADPSADTHNGIEEAAFATADTMLALSAPDAIEALEELSTAADLLQCECWTAGNEQLNKTVTIVRSALDVALAVLARYKETSHD